MSVLIVDDQPLLAEIFGDAFRMVGEDAEVLVDGRQAAHLAAHRRFDVIVTDLLMPDFDGLELIRAVRQHDPSAKIIAVTGGGHFKAGELLDVACKLGADGALAKPFEPFELVRLARQLIAKTRLKAFKPDDIAVWH